MCSIEKNEENSLVCVKIMHLPYLVIAHFKSKKHEPL